MSEEPPDWEDGDKFAINFAVGVATGLVMEFRFGTNWSRDSRFVGDVFGSALAPVEEMAGQAVELLASHHPRPGEMDAYERVLGEAMAGDATLFAREDHVEEAWRIVDPVLKRGTPVYQYEPNAWGPREADDHLSAAAGWQNPTVAEGAAGPG